MHTETQVKNELISEGFIETSPSVFKCLISNFEAAGTISNGDRMVTLTIDETGRWFSRVDGWGKVERDVDLCNFVHNPIGAIKAVLK